MQADWSVTERGGVCLVRVVVENPAPVARRVAVSNRLDGPVLPPRREGVPERGWTDDGFEGTVPAEGRLPLGYACPAPALRPPVDVEATGRADARPDGSTETTPEAAVRRLGAHAPPADAVPVPSPDAAGDAAGGDASARAGADAPVGDFDVRSELPDAVPADAAAWLAAVGGRIDRAERLDGGSVAAATEVVRETGGLEAVTGLPDRLSADAAALRAVARRADRLADRAEAADVPVDALRRLS